MRIALIDCALLVLYCHQPEEQRYHEYKGDLLRLAFHLNLQKKQCSDAARRYLTKLIHKIS